MKLYILLISLAANILLAACSSHTPQLGIDPIDEVIAAMTLEEKAAFVVGTERDKATPPDAAPGMPQRPMFSPSMQAKFDACKDSSEVFDLLVSTNSVTYRVAGAAGVHIGIPRLGIEPIVYADGPTGLRIDPKREGSNGEYYCTAFPIGSALAASWDVDLMRSVASAIGNEVHEYGVDILLAPAMNIQRNPLCGRNFEYYSEDPVLAGQMAAAYIQGIQSQKVGVSLKHFAVNNNETHRNGVDARLSERAMREIYLRGFEIAVRKAQPWTIMSSYNKINGTLASENAHLLNEILRDEWGFKGFVMSDWWAEENGARQIAAGNDLLMPGSQHQYDEIISAVKDGSLDETLLDKAVRNIMNVMLQTPTYQHYTYSNLPDLEAHAAITRRASAESMVLLRNEQAALPLDTALIHHVALFGTASYDLLVGGSGSGYVNRKYKVSLHQGLHNAGIEVCDGMTCRYLNYIAESKAAQPAENFWVVPVVPEMPLDDSFVQSSISQSDIVIFTLSRMAGEGGDRQYAAGDYLLSPVEEANLRCVCKAAHQAHRKVILVLNMGNIVDITSIASLPDAILHGWMGGQEMGNSLADVLTGKVSPSGKLPFTWAHSYSDYSSSANFPCSDPEGSFTNYTEDVMVGYRYFDTNHVQPLYPFGYGLSYTSFDYNGLEIETHGDSISVSISVTNVGQCSGRESLQLYISKPQLPDLLMPVKELVAFAKTGDLQPSQSQQLHFTFTRRDAASFVESTNSWVAAPGTYQILLGSNSQHIVAQQAIEL